MLTSLSISTGCQRGNVLSWEMLGHREPFSFQSPGPWARSPLAPFLWLSLDTPPPVIMGVGGHLPRQLPALPSLVVGLAFDLGFLASSAFWNLKIENKKQSHNHLGWLNTCASDRLSGEFHSVTCSQKPVAGSEQPCETWAERRSFWLSNTQSSGQRPPAGKRALESQPERTLLLCTLLCSLPVPFLSRCQDPLGWPGPLCRVWL